MEGLTFEPLEGGKSSHAEGRRVEAALGRGEIKDGVLLEGRNPSEFKAAQELSQKAVAQAEETLASLKARAIKEEGAVSAQELMAAEANLEVLRQDHAKKFLN